MREATDCRKVSPFTPGLRARVGLDRDVCKTDPGDADEASAVTERRYGSDGLQC